jgi:Cu(I)/Ag(I) efflux system membrane protein CusA/SilA
VANIVFTKGATMVKSENARPAARVYVDIQAVDVGSYVGTTRKAVEQSLSLPAGYSIVWSGQYKIMQAMAEKLKVIIPLTVIVILLLLFMHFKNLINCLMVVISLPFALVGGIWLFYIFGYNTSVAVYVGFIALAGRAAETSVVMLFYLEEAIARYGNENRLRS